MKPLQGPTKQGPRPTTASGLLSALSSTLSQAIMITQVVSNKWQTNADVSDYKRLNFNEPVPVRLPSSVQGPVVPQSYSQLCYLTSSKQATDRRMPSWFTRASVPIKVSATSLLFYFGGVLGHSSNAIRLIYALTCSKGRMKCYSAGNTRDWRHQPLPTLLA
jgi:hypothetical protein